jgi:hypothetical protein
LISAPINLVKKINKNLYHRLFLINLIHFYIPLIPAILLTFVLSTGQEGTHL